MQATVARAPGQPLPREQVLVPAGAPGRIQVRAAAPDSAPAAR